MHGTGRFLRLVFLPQGQNYFEVPAGNLGFSVILFTSCAVIAIILLVTRRFVAGAELGGPTVLKYVSAVILVALWVIYVLMSSFQTYGIINVTIGSG